MSIPRPEISQLIEGIKKSDRIALAKAITLVESSLPADQENAAKLIDTILPLAGNSIRLGITGVPGVGKSTFIESFGGYLTALQKKIAVLTVDPTSEITRGSILGDKTRMEELSKNKLAFIRPSASGTMLGGVSHGTRQAITLCEAAGFDVIIIETVGVGQSEVAVKKMTDFFLLLMLAGAGDELQGIKKGIVEMADAIVITKADGDNVANATRAQAEYQHALHLSTSSSRDWHTKVLTCSAITGSGIADVWQNVTRRIDRAKQSGSFEHNRRQQNLAWFHESFTHLLRLDVDRREQINHKKDELLAQVESQSLSPPAAAKMLLDHYHKVVRESQ